MNKAIEESVGLCEVGQVHHSSPQVALLHPQNGKIMPHLHFDFSPLLDNLYLNFNEAHLK